MLYKIIFIDENEIETENTQVPDFLTNLNHLAEQGKLDPVIGRSQEIRKIQEILCRRTKNNPVLIGSPCRKNCHSRWFSWLNRKRNSTRHY